MFLKTGDDAYPAIYTHYLAENYPQRFNYQGYFWQTERQDDGTLAFRRMNLVPVFEQTTHADRPGLKHVIPIDEVPNF